MIAFLSSGEPVRTPFAGRCGYSSRRRGTRSDSPNGCASSASGSADIRRRGLAGDVTQIQRRLGLRGEGAATIVLTRVDDKPWGLICVPL